MTLVSASCSHLRSRPDVRGVKDSDTGSSRAPPRGAHGRERPCASERAGQAETAGLTGAQRGECISLAYMPLRTLVAPWGTANGSTRGEAGRLMRESLWT